jgi:hypothetical protein
MGISRLRRECAAIMKAPIENIEAVPLETNIHEWHYVIKGVKGNAVSSTLQNGVVTCLSFLHFFQFSDGEISGAGRCDSILFSCIIAHTSHISCFSSHFERYLLLPPFSNTRYFLPFVTPV